MHAPQSLTAVTLAVALAVLASACSKADDTAAPRPATPVTTTAATPAPVGTPVAPAPTPAVAFPTDVPAGTTVPADLIEDARAAGIPIYVSPTGDGTGTVVDPTGPLPDGLVAEIAAVDGVPTSAAHFSQLLGSLTQILRAHDAAGTKVIVIVAMANVTASSADVIGYTAAGTAATGGFASSGAKAAVLDAAHTYAAANPGTTVIDLTA